jgi:zinc protease
VYGYTGTDQFIRGYDAFISFAVLGDNTTKEAIDALLAETERARKFGFLATELERTKANLLNEAEQRLKKKIKRNHLLLFQIISTIILKGALFPVQKTGISF